MLKIFICVCVGVVVMLFCIIILKLTTLETFTKGYITGFLVTLSNSAVLSYMRHLKSK